MELITKAGSLLLIVIVALQLMLLLYRVAARRLVAARLDSEFRVLLRQLTATAPQITAVSRELHAAEWQGKREFQIAWREYETLDQGICSFYLTPCDGKPLQDFRAGQFLTFELPVPGEPQSVRRCYSLSEDPTQKQYYRTTIKKIGGSPVNPPGRSSNYFHNDLQVGDTVQVYAPAGSFFCDEQSGRPIVLIAGGIGLTPLLSMLRWLATSGCKTEVWLFHGVTNRLDHAMREELYAVQRAMPNVRVVTFYSEPTPDCLVGVDYDVQGFVRVECMKPLLRARDYLYYVCGPPAMMDAVMADLVEWGVPQHDIFSESFIGSGEPGVRLIEAPANSDMATETVAVTFARSNTTVHWTPDKGSLLELAEASGIKARFTCRAGNCGTCATAVIRGEFAYEEPPAHSPQEGFCLPCMARPRGELMLDL